LGSGSHEIADRQSRSSRVFAGAAIASFSSMVQRRRVRLTPTLDTPSRATSPIIQVSTLKKKKTPRRAAALQQAGQKGRPPRVTLSAVFGKEWARLVTLLAPSRETGQLGALSPNSTSRLASPASRLNLNISSTRRMAILSVGVGPSKMRKP